MTIHPEPVEIELRPRCRVLISMRTGEMLAYQAPYKGDWVEDEGAIARAAQKGSRP